MYNVMLTYQAHAYNSGLKMQKIVQRLKISVFEKKNSLLLQVSDFGTAQLETISKNVDHCGFPPNTEVSLFYVKSISRNFREIDFTKKLL